MAAHVSLDKIISQLHRQSRTAKRLPAASARSRLPWARPRRPGPGGPAAAVPEEGARGCAGSAALCAFHHSRGGVSRFEGPWGRDHVCVWRASPREPFVTPIGSARGRFRLLGCGVGSGDAVPPPPPPGGRCCEEASCTASVTLTLQQERRHSGQVGLAPGRALQPVAGTPPGG